MNPKIVVLVFATALLASCATNSPSVPSLGSEAGDSFVCSPEGDGLEVYERRIVLGDGRAEDKISGVVSGNIRISDVISDSIDEQYLLIEIREYVSPDAPRLKFVHRSDMSTGKGYISAFLLSSGDQDSAVKVGDFDAKDDQLFFELKFSEDGRLYARVNGKSASQRGRSVWPTHLRVSCTSLNAVLTGVVVRTN